MRLAPHFLDLAQPAALPCRRGPAAAALPRGGKLCLPRHAAPRHAPPAACETVPAATPNGPRRKPVWHRRQARGARFANPARAGAGTGMAAMGGGGRTMFTNRGRGGPTVRPVMLANVKWRAAAGAHRWPTAKKWLPLHTGPHHAGRQAAPQRAACSATSSMSSGVRRAGMPRRPQPNQDRQT